MFWCLPGFYCFFGCGVVYSSRTPSSLAHFNVCVWGGGVCVHVCLSLCVYPNPSGQVYNRIGMRLWPFVNDRPTKSHSTSLAFLRLLPPSFLSSLSPSFLLCLSLCLRRNASIMTGQAKPGCFSCSHSKPNSPHFLSLSCLSAVCMHFSFISSFHALPLIPPSWFESQINGML